MSYGEAFHALYGSKGIAPTAAVRIQAEAEAMAWTFSQTTIRPDFVATPTWTPVARCCEYCGSTLEALRCESCGAPDRGAR